MVVVGDENSSFIIHCSSFFCGPRCSLHFKRATSVRHAQVFPRSQAPAWERLNCRLRLLALSLTWTVTLARRSLAGSAFPGRAWERGGIICLVAAAGRAADSALSHPRSSLRLPIGLKVALSIANFHEISRFFWPLLSALFILEAITKRVTANQSRMIC